MKTGRPCRACAHPARPKIDAALARGEAVDALVSLFGIARSNLYRHRAHLRPAAAKAAETPASTSARDPEKALDLVILQTFQLLQDARKNGTRRETLAALRQVRENLEAVSKIRATAPPPWDPVRDEVLIDVRNRVAKVLSACPSCRQKVADLFRGLAEVPGV